MKKSVINRDIRRVPRIADRPQPVTWRAAASATSHSMIEEWPKVKAPSSVRTSSEPDPIGWTACAVS